jgi:hypothetical protein
VIDLAATIVAGGCLIGSLLIVLATTHPRRNPVPPVPRRAMRRLSDRLAELPDDSDGTR